MDQLQQSRPSGKLRPLGLSCSLCFAAFLAAFAVKSGLMLFSYFFLAAAGGIFAVLYLTGKQLVFPVISASISVMLLQILGGFTASLCGVSFFICSLVLAFQVKKSAPKTSVLVTFSLILGSMVLLLALFSYAIQGGSLVPSDLLDKYHQFFKELKIVLSETVHEMVNSMDERTLAFYAQMEISKEHILKSYLDTMEYAVDLVQVILPGIFAFAMQLLAYLSISAFRLTAKVLQIDALLPAPVWPLIPSQISCIFYLITSCVYMIGSFFADDTSVFMVLMANLWLVLLPSMLFCGFRVLFLRLSHPMFRAGTGMTIAVFVLGIFFLPSIAIQLALFSLSFLGAQTISAKHMADAEKTKKQK